MALPPMTPQQKREYDKMYSGAIPEIAQAYQNDPKTQIANNIIAQGTTTDPVAGGNWGYADGLSRVGQALIGKKLMDRQNERYGNFEQGMQEGMAAQAAQLGTANPATANPAAVNPGTAAQSQVAAALTPQSQRVPQAGDVQSFTPPPSAPAMNPGQGQGMAPAQAMAAAAPGAPMRGRSEGVAGPSLAAPANGPERASLSAVDLYANGIIPIEGGTDADGTFRTSSKGAIGPGQVMPSTAPEAAKLAGLPWDEEKYKSDYDYNYAIGEAYFTEKLREWDGDPEKAAAAYNAGSGRLRRAIRAANKNGGAWRDYMPEETKKYVDNFTARVGVGGAGGGVGGAGEGAGAYSPTAVTSAPQYALNDLPEGPAAPQSGPAVPEAVQSQYMQMAQGLLQSNNPFLAQLGRTYLEQGMKDTFKAQGDQAANQFQSNRDQYGTEASNYLDSQAARRDYTFGLNRDYARYNHEGAMQNNRQTFEAGENAASRNFQSEEAAKQRRWQERTAREQAEFEAQIKKQYGNGRNPFLDTQVGMKIYEEKKAAISNANESIFKYKRMIELMEEGGDVTGGLYSLPGVGDYLQQMGMGNSKNLGEIVAFMNDTTLGKLGGSLGTAISDGDRNFIAQSNANLSTDVRSNIQVAKASIAMLQRKKDYEQAQIQAMAAGTDNVGRFDAMWEDYVNSVPIINYDKSGNAIVNDNPITFESWMGRTKYDAQGNEVQ